LFSGVIMPIDRRSLCFGVPAFAAALAIDAKASSVMPGEPSSIASFIKPFDQLPASQHPTNTSRAILNGTTASGCVMEVHETTLGPGMSPHPPHHHKHDEMFLIAKGTLEVTIAGKTATIGPGSAAYVHSNEEHGVRNPGSVDAQYFVVATGAES
jgi:mannose-6-phosphate isomerase-like protein (cupin superfamily)